MLVLHALATASPPHDLRQDAALVMARRLFGDDPAFGRMASVFENAGIVRRQSAQPLAWFAERHGWPDRQAACGDCALELIERAALDSLEAADVPADSIDAIVTVCSTAIQTPSLEARLMERLPFRRDVERLPIFGLGCAGGVLGLARAAALARARPGCRVLLLVVEICTLAFRRDDRRKSNIVASALFGDGAAAALVEARDDVPRGGAVIDAWGEHAWPGTLDVMGWTIEEDGLGVVFSRDIPALVRDRLRAAADAFLVRAGVPWHEIAGVICHPGGRKVIDALEDTFELQRGTLDAERHVIREHGNMSAPTVLFVLGRRFAEGVAGRHLMTALGPGFTAGFALLDLAGLST